MSHDKPWPIDDNSYNKHHVYYCRIKTGVMILSVSDWGRGQDDINARAEGCVGTRLVGKVVHAGTCAHSFQDECYPNIKSAEMRWWNFGKVLRDEPTERKP